MTFEKLENRFCLSGTGRVKDALHINCPTINDFAVDVSAFANKSDAQRQAQNAPTPMPLQASVDPTQTNPTMNAGFEMRYENGVIVCYVVGTFECVDLYSLKIT